MYLIALTNIIFSFYVFLVTCNFINKIFINIVLFIHSRFKKYALFNT